MQEAKPRSSAWTHEGAGTHEVLRSVTKCQTRGVKRIQYGHEAVKHLFPRRTLGRSPGGDINVEDGAASDPRAWSKEGPGSACVLLEPVTSPMHIPE